MQHHLCERLRSQLRLHAIVCALTAETGQDSCGAARALNASASNESAPAGSPRRLCASGWLGPTSARSRALAADGNAAPPPAGMRPPVFCRLL